MTTASAPSGTGAPVVIRTASPRPIAPSRSRPGRASPAIARTIGAYAVAPNVASPESA
jgi:hypothetical protein